MVTVKKGHQGEYIERDISGELSNALDEALHNGRTVQVDAIIDVLSTVVEILVENNLMSNEDVDALFGRIKS